MQSHRHEMKVRRLAGFIFNRGVRFLSPEAEANRGIQVAFAAPHRIVVSAGTCISRSEENDLVMMPPDTDCSGASGLSRVALGCPADFLTANVH